VVAVLLALVLAVVAALGFRAMVTMHQERHVERASAKPTRLIADSGKLISYEKCVTTFRPRNAAIMVTGFS
jgi:hypothetical protein